MAGYEVERPPLFAAVLSAAKRALDPTGILNPGILLSPQPAALK
jgi:alkyldihydroxyacetonephosphate synthase